MDDYQLSGEHVYRTLAFLADPAFRPKYLSSFHTDEQREWAKQLLRDYESGLVKEVSIVPGQDSVCRRCNPCRQSQCTYKAKPIALNGKEFPFGAVSIDELLKNFDPVKFLRKEEENEKAFYLNLMQTM
jgi:hypothetical protein